MSANELPTIRPEWSAAHGYQLAGPILTEGQRPWTRGWELNPAVDDGHSHRWELVTDPSRPRGYDEVVRCSTCHAPRCGQPDLIGDPCMRQRDHEGDHVPLSDWRALR